jgi:hypothetical protein
MAKDSDTGYAGDNDPIDVCELGSVVRRTGDVIQVKVHQLLPLYHGIHLVFSCYNVKITGVILLLQLWCHFGSYILIVCMGMYLSSSM